MDKKHRKSKKIILFSNLYCLKVYKMIEISDKVTYN